MKPVKPVAVVGMGCLCSAGLNLQQTVETFYRGERSPAPPIRFANEYEYRLPVFEILDEFFPTGAFKHQHLLRTCQLALTATRQALQDADLDLKRLNGARIGVCIGTNVGSSMNNEAFYRDNTEGCDPYIPPQERFLMSNPTEGIAMEFGANGPCQTVVNACSAGSDALGLAAAWIRSGICDIVISGGADELYQVTYAGFKSLLIHDASPCKPFDAHRRGLNLGEGAAIFILMSEAMTQRHVKSPRGFLLGYGSAADAFHFTKPRPDGLGLRTALHEALDTSGLAPSDITFINAHGTGTLDNDLIESTLINDMFPEAPFLSTKGYTGHTLGASGAIEAAVSLAFLENQLLPANIGFTDPDPELPAQPVSKNTAIDGNIAISQTLAFGGNNAALAIGTKPTES